MNDLYVKFNYNADFTPTHFIFNTNSDNKRFVGINSSKPESF